MADNLFLGLPPPSAKPNIPPALPSVADQQASKDTTRGTGTAPAPAPAPAPILKSALKREKPTETQTEASETAQKRLRFKTTVDASETQVIEAMQRITAHIKNPAKFSKASKLAMQLIQAGSVKPGTSDQFFDILETAMSSPSACNDPSVRADYHSLFSAAQNINECLSKKQRNQLTTWTLRAVVGNDLYTDDSFVVFQCLEENRME
ncbi:uncharacterized protein LOC122088049 [Macadamia integrifolia]|uniref:uncharacterized protein LOC122088049 n=1 Tax=Macadamia integrifolia TaxID=60698 RepID=UPI001C4F71D3|nr:uncharacterized protein LOC122088049 [Macadamia integrifolia]